MVYLIADYQRTVCKIGYSENPIKRLAQLQTSSPSPLVLLNTLVGDRKLEKRLHEIFWEYKIKGEWFEYARIIENHFIEEIQKAKELKEKLSITDQKEYQFPKEIIDKAYSIINGYLNTSKAKFISKKREIVFAELLEVNLADFQRIIYILKERGKISSIGNGWYLSDVEKIKYIKDIVRWYEYHEYIAHFNVGYYKPEKD